MRTHMNKVHMTTLAAVALKLASIEAEGKGNHDC